MTDEDLMVKLYFKGNGTEMYELLDDCRADYESTHTDRFHYTQSSTPDGISIRFDHPGYYPKSIIGSHEGAYDHMELIYPRIGTYDSFIAECRMMKHNLNRRKA